VGLIRDWVKDRFGLGPIWEHALRRRVARGPWYYGDGAALALLLGVLVFTGVLMTLTYTPHPDHAYASVQRITTQERMGWFIRGLHYWAAGMMVVLIVVHVLRQILVGGYKFPREGTWLIGVCLFFLVMVMAFTGYVLRWDERAVHALKVSMHMFYRVPWIGERLAFLVQGGPEMGAATATRIYSVHVLITPLLILALVAYHLYLVEIHGITSRPERRRRIETSQEQKRIYKAAAHSRSEGEHFYPSTVFSSGLFAMVVFAVVALAAWLAGPPELLDPALADPLAFPAEEWWFWWYSGLIAHLPPSVAPWFVVIFPVALLAVLVLLPFVDRGPARGIRQRPWAVVVVILVAVSLLYFTDVRRRSPWTGWPAVGPPELPVDVHLPDRAERGRILFAEYGCTACHAIAGRGPRVGTDLARLSPLYSRAEMRVYILRPPPGVPMPPYEGRISDGDLERILDFIHAAQAFPRK
jgi:ubiquinol-cytochrome c reductase cytochrome b subunit